MTADSQQAERELRDKLFDYPQDSTCIHCLSTWNDGPYHRDDCLFVRFEAAARAAGRAEAAERIEALEDVLQRFMFYVDEWGYESHGALAKRFGPVEHEGSSISVEAWLDRVLRVPAARALLPHPAEGPEASEGDSRG